MLGKCHVSTISPTTSPPPRQTCASPSSVHPGHPSAPAFPRVQSATKLMSVSVIPVQTNGHQLTIQCVLLYVLNTDGLRLDWIGLGWI